MALTFTVYGGFDFFLVHLSSLVFRVLCHVLIKFYFFAGCEQSSTHPLQFCVCDGFQVKTMGVSAEL